MEKNDVILLINKRNAAVTAYINLSEYIFMYEPVNFRLGLALLKFTRIFSSIGVQPYWKLK